MYKVLIFFCVSPGGGGVRGIFVLARGVGGPRDICVSPGGGCLRDSCVSPERGVFKGYLC